MSEMMAIGDSLFNGVRSLTIDSHLAQWSPPKQVAKALGIQFAVPDYPAYVVVNFEHWLREFPKIGRILADLNGNIDFWNRQPPSALAQFDNIAIASTTWSDLNNRTWKTAQSELDAINSEVKAGKTKYLDHLPDLFFAFNTRFILNPSGSHTTKALSPVEIVAERKPKRLLVCIGSNNGLWRMAFNAVSSPGFNVEDELYGPSDIADCTTFFESLAGLPKDIANIYVIALPWPSTTANMMPVPDDAINTPPGAGKFWPKYENRFGFNYGTLTGTQVGENNQTIIDLAKFITTLLGKIGDPRIHVVPVDKAFIDYDYKANPMAKYILTDDQKILSNIMIDSYSDSDGAHWYGGLIGLDGMHPTIIGYNLMAEVILDTIKKFEPTLKIPHSLPTVDQAYQADSLVKNVPKDWHEILYVWRDIRKAFISGRALPDDARVRSVKSFMMMLSSLGSGPARRRTQFDHNEH